MELVKFLNNHPDNWQELLAAEPYNIEIHSDTINDVEYWILKYNMINSNMSSKLVQEARGSIFRKNDAGEWICVCHPFDKFFNYGEQHSAVHEIDWETASVQQKVDGSLIKIWYDNNLWHISTNGSINAFSAGCGETSYGLLVADAISNIPDFWYALNPTRCYMFELTSPYNHIVIQYEGIHLWYLGCRDMENDTEIDEEFNVEGILHPALFPHHSLSECVMAAHEMGEDEEGYVVCDKNFNRIKIKGDEYLRLHKIRGNGPLTTLRVVEMWQNDSLDDFVAYYPEFEEFAQNVLNEIGNLVNLSEIAYKVVSGYDTPERRDFARYANTYKPPIRSYLYAKLDNKVEDAIDFFAEMRARTLASYIMAEMETTEIGTKEDE